MKNKLLSRRGETFAGIICSLLIAALALYLLRAALSPYSFGKSAEKSEERYGTVETVFTLGEASYEARINVRFTEEGYVYAPE